MESLCGGKHCERHAVGGEGNAHLNGQTFPTSSACATSDDEATCATGGELRSESGQTHQLQVEEMGQGRANRAGGTVCGEAQTDPGAQVEPGHTGHQ